MLSSSLKYSVFFHLAMAIFLTLYGSSVTANPTGGSVVAGDATIATSNSKILVIDQSTPKAIIEWGSFDVESDEVVRFVLPDTEAWTLNRVVGSQNPSRILGSVQSNGSLVIVNPDGIHFGPDSRVDVNRLIATSHDILNDSFMAGRFVFDIPGKPTASIVNEGTISIADYGLGAFVAPAVRNSGTIVAKL